MRLIVCVATAVLAVAGCAYKSEHSAEHSPTPSSKPLAATTTTAAPFAAEISAFEAIDRSPNAPAHNGIVFYGSSSIRMWKSLAADFLGLPVVNRGFGGSTMDQCVMYLDRAVVGLHPRTVVVYAGDNDLAAGHSVERVVSDTRQFFDDVHARLPRTQIVYLSIKPSPSRAKLLPQLKDANARIKAMAGARHVDFVDVATPMLGDDGQPKEELFGSDRLHMNEKGYAIWAAILKPLLK